MRKSNKTCNENALPILLSISELKSIGIGRSMAYKLLNSEKLPVVQIGARKFMLRDKFMEWLENGGDSTLAIE